MRRIIFTAITAAAITPIALTVTHLTMPTVTVMPWWLAVASIATVRAWEWFRPTS